MHISALKKVDIINSRLHYKRFLDFMKGKMWDPQSSSKRISPTKQLFLSFLFFAAVVPIVQNIKVANINYMNYNILRQ